MRELLATTGAVLPCLVLIVAGVDHLRHGAAFEGALARQGSLPRFALRPLRVLVPILELGLAATALILLFGFQSASGTAAVLYAVAGLYAVYAVYTGHLMSKGGGVPCGCAAMDSEVGAPVVLRAAGLGATAALAAAVNGSLLTAALDDRFLIASAAAVALSVVVWTLPAALRRPEPASEPGPATGPLTVIHHGGVS